MYESEEKDELEESLIVREHRIPGTPKINLSERHKVTYCVKVTLIGIILHCIADGFAFGTSGYSNSYISLSPGIFIQLYDIFGSYSQQSTRDIFCCNISSSRELQEIYYSHDNHCIFYFMVDSFHCFPYNRFISLYFPKYILKSCFR